jgi:glycogen debranching enzyme
LLVRRNRRLGFDLRRIVNESGPVCCEVVTNVLYALSLLALGRPSLTPRLVERLYDESTGLFKPAVWPSQIDSFPVTWSALAPLALPDLPAAIARRLVEEHLLDPQRFWLPVPPSSVSAADPAFSTRDGLPGLRRYWRGPTWVNAAWLLWLGLRRLGYDDAARTLVERLGAAVQRAGLREYYHPYTGRGMGARGFAWSSLMVEMIDSPGDPGVG